MGFYLPINQLLFPEPVTAGMNFLKLGSMAYFYRAGNEDLEPILVGYSDWADGAYQLTDGRHRTVASMIAGRKTVLAVLE